MVYGARLSFLDVNSLTRIVSRCLPCVPLIYCVFIKIDVVRSRHFQLSSRPTADEKVMEMKLIDRIRYWNRARRFAKVHETFECQFVKDCISAGDTVLDIGANKGAFTYWLSESVGPTGCVHSFEPQPSMVCELNRMASAIRFQNVAVHRIALSDTPGTATLHVPFNHTCASLESDSGVGETGESYKVDLARLDDYLGGIASNKSIDFIKCDVEGHELSVFKGAEQTLKSSLPLLLFESFIPHSDATKNPVFEFLFRIGYSGFGFEEQKLTPLNSIKSTTSHHNFVFLSPEKHCLTNFVPPYRIERLSKSLAA